jgi:hypothetical protein
VLAFRERRGAGVLARLSHPCLIQPHDVGMEASEDRSAHISYLLVGTVQDMLVRRLLLHGLVLCRTHADVLSWLVWPGIKKSGPLVIPVLHRRTALTAPLGAELFGHGVYWGTGCNRRSVLCVAMGKETVDIRS